MTQVRRRQVKELKESLRVAAELEKEELPLPRRPRTDLPELRGDLSDLEDNALIDLLVVMTRWADYSGGQLALAEVDESYAEALLDKLKAFAYVQGAGDKVTTVRAELQMDEEYQDGVQAKLTAYARRKLLTARHTAFERDAAVISRELSRRIEREPSLRRTSRLGGAR